MEILSKQEGFRLDPKVHFPVKMARTGPTSESGCAFPFSQFPSRVSTPLALVSGPDHPALDLWLPEKATL